MATRSTPRGAHRSRRVSSRRHTIRHAARRDAEPAAAIGGAVVGGLGVAAFALWDAGPHEAPRHVAAHAHQHQGMPGPGGRVPGVAQIAGTVVSVQPGTLVITEGNGQQVTETTTPQTRVRGNGKSALADLRPGDRVILRVDANNQVLAVLAQ